MSTRSRAVRFLAAGALMSSGLTAAAGASAVAAPAAAQSGSSASVAAAAVGCSGSYSRGPYFYAGVDASIRAGKRMVMDIQGPWTTAGTQAHMWSWYNGQSQYWCLAPVQNGSSGGTFYGVRNYYSGKCLDSGATGYGTLVKQQDCSLSKYSQLWWITNKGSYSTPEGSKTAYEFRSLANGQGYCLDGKDFGSTDGTVLQTWSCSNGRNQRFY
ncbi:RICIN domain-containing protein [Streptomyces sp. NPDC020490]|uniref:RICIN domain-containing protein n=1 Tax=Streptomyces sp. NPDC020490 TaxID=3365078 RepID=UPI0037BB5D93